MVGLVLNKFIWKSKMSSGLDGLFANLEKVREEKIKKDPNYASEKVSFGNKEEENEAKNEEKSQNNLENLKISSDAREEFVEETKDKSTDSMEDKPKRTQESDKQQRIAGNSVPVKNEQRSSGSFGSEKQKDSKNNSIRSSGIPSHLLANTKLKKALEFENYEIGEVGEWANATAKVKKKNENGPSGFSSEEEDEEEHQNRDDDEFDIDLDPNENQNYYKGPKVNKGESADQKKELKGESKEERHEGNGMNDGEQEKDKGGLEMEEEKEAQGNDENDFVFDFEDENEANNEENNGDGFENPNPNQNVVGASDAKELNSREFSLPPQAPVPVEKKRETGWSLKEGSGPKKEGINLQSSFKQKLDEEEKMTKIEETQKKPVTDDKIMRRILEKVEGKYHVNIEMGRREGYFKCQLAEKEAKKQLIAKQREAEEKREKAEENLREAEIPKESSPKQQETRKSLEESKVPMSIISQDSGSPLKPRNSEENKNTSPQARESQELSQNANKPEARSSLTRKEQPNHPIDKASNVIDFITAWEHVKKMDLSKEKQVVRKETKSLKALSPFNCFSMKLPAMLLTEKNQIIAFSRCIPSQTNKTLNSFLFSFYTILTMKPISMALGEEWKTIGFTSDNPVKELAEAGVGMLGVLQMLALVQFHLHQLEKFYEYSLTRKKQFQLGNVLLQSSKSSLVALALNKLDKEILQRKSVISVVNQFYFACVFNFFVSFVRDSGNENMNAEGLLKSNEFYAKKNPDVLLKSYKKNLRYLEKIADQDIEDDFKF